MRHVVAPYEIDRHWGGPEEGGWWYDAGELRRIVAIAFTEAAASALARRANRLLDRLQRSRRPVGSVLYAGGQHRALVFRGAAPSCFPEARPTYC